MRVQSYINDYILENDFELIEGETYGEAYQRIVNSNPRLHNHEELQALANQLLDDLMNEFGFKATRVFAYYPLISTKEYHGFEEVYLYQKIHEAMRHKAQSFCLLNKVNEKFDKQMLQHEFEEAYRTTYGYIPFSDMEGKTNDLISYMRLVRQHGFDETYCKVLEEDIKHTLILLGDKYFNTLDLTDKKNIGLLYECCGIFYGFTEYRRGLFQEYDGFGNVVSVNNEDYIVNDLSYIIGGE